MKTGLNQEEVDVLKDILGTAWCAYPSDAGSTYKHIRLLKNFGIIKPMEILCNMCIQKVIDEHAENCPEYKKHIDKPELISMCPEEHYSYDYCEEATWMVSSEAVNKAEKRAIGKNYKYEERVKWLEETFPDIAPDIRYNPCTGFLCDGHIGSMKQYANKI